MPLLPDMLEAWRFTRDGVIAELENLPDARFDERPANLKRSALDLANHIVESGWLMAGELSRADGDFLRKPYPELIAELNPDRPAATRSDALAVLRRSLEQGMALLRDAGEALLLQQIRQFNGVPATRITWMHHGIAHEEYHRGQLALYARLFGRTPALTKLIEGETASA